MPTKTTNRISEIQEDFVETGNGKSTTKKKPKKTVVPMSAEIRCTAHKKGPITVDEMKEILGWEEVEEGEFLFKDVFGSKIVLRNNPDNRSFSRSIADRYAQEFLSKKWRLNLESFIVSKTGKIRSGQHRGVGFILAEQLRQLNPSKYGNKSLVYETLVAYGAEDSKDVKDSYDKGRSRDLKDVLFGRNIGGKKVSEAQRQKLSRILSTAIRLTWIRCGGGTVSSAKHFPHSVALEFFDQHKGLCEVAERILELEDGKTKAVSQHITLGYATALYYLMMHSEHDNAAEKADEFWTSLAEGAGLEKDSPILSLSKWAVNAKSGSGGQRDEKVGAFIKSFNHFCSGESLTVKQVPVKKKRVKVLIGEEEVVKLVPSEFPYLGGLDIGQEALEELQEEDAKELSVKELLVLRAIKDSKEATFLGVSESTNLSRGIVTKIVNGESELSLVNRGLVVVEEQEPEEGEKVPPYLLTLTEEGVSILK